MNAVPSPVSLLRVQLVSRLHIPVKSAKPGNEQQFIFNVIVTTCCKVPKVATFEKNTAYTAKEYNGL